MRFCRWILFALAFMLLAACGQAAPASPAAGDKLSVVVTTTIVGDVVRNVGGESVNVSVLLPVGADPHSFEPTPQDVARVSRAQLIFINGAGLEAFLQPMLKNAGAQAQVIAISDGIELLQPAEESGHEDEHSGGDPHVWFDPRRVMVWTENIEKALSQADPANAETYAANAAAYRQQLEELDGWIKDQVAQIPQGNRKLVSDHTSFTYLADRYGFEQVGAIIPGYSTLAEPTAQELAALEDAIRSLGVKAVFVGETVNPNLSQRVASDTGVQLIRLYNGSLSAPDGPAATYLDFMRYDVTKIVEALK